MCCCLNIVSRHVFTFARTRSSKCRGSIGGSTAGGDSREPRWGQVYVDSSDDAAPSSSSSTGGRKKRTACPSGQTRERFRAGPRRGLLDRALLPSAPIRRPSHVEQRRRGQAVDPHVFRFTTFLHSFRRGTSGLVQRPSDSLLLANSSEHGYRLLSTQHTTHTTHQNTQYTTPSIHVRLFTTLRALSIVTQARL